MNKELIKIIYEDKNIVIADKPSGLAVITNQTDSKEKNLLFLLSSQINAKLFAIHSIDKNASGLVVFTKNEISKKFIAEQFENCKVSRKYTALLSGVLEEESATLDKPVLVSGKDNVIVDISGKAAKTKFKVLEKFRSYTLVEAEPLTSIRQQIRVHFWDLGHPLAIDKDYGSDEPIYLSSFKAKYKEKRGLKEKPLINRLPLHLAEISLIVPGENKKRTFKSQLPKDFEITLKQMRKYGR